MTFRTPQSSSLDQGLMAQVTALDVLWDMEAFLGYSQRLLRIEKNDLPFDTDNASYVVIHLI